MIDTAEIFKDVVTRAAEIYGADINYYYGHPDEINNRITTANKGRSTNKFPAIFYFLSEDVDRQSTTHFGDFSPSFAIVHSTKGKLITQQRIEQKFKPVIWPIYEAFMQAVDESIMVNNAGEETFLKHKFHNHFFYGSDLNNNSEKLFDTQLDAMTIDFDSLAITNAEC